MLRNPAPSDHEDAAAVWQHKLNKTTMAVGAQPAQFIVGNKTDAAPLSILDGSQEEFREVCFEPVSKMGGAGDPPALFGDPPTGTAADNVAKRPCPLARTAAPVPSGESPDGTGGSPVLPANNATHDDLTGESPGEMEKGQAGFGLVRSLLSLF